MKKKLASLLLAAAMILSLCPFSFAYNVAEWARESVERGDEMGLVPPAMLDADLTQRINRQDFAALCVSCYSIMGGELPTSEMENPFEDTDDPYVLMACMLGFTNGRTSTTFSPETYLTRQQGSTMLTRVYKKLALPGWTLANDADFTLDTTGAPNFKDADRIDAYAKQSVDFMALHKILLGMSDGSFAPADPLTGQQAIVIALRMIDNLDV